MAKVFVEPIGVTFEVAESETLMDALTRVAIDVPNVCAGRGTCGKCLVRLGAGELTPPTEIELRKVPEKLRDAGWRLACQAHPASPRVSIEVRETSGRRRILTTSRLHHGRPQPAVTRVTADARPAGASATRAATSNACRRSCTASRSPTGRCRRSPTCCASTAGGPPSRATGDA